tara:strand:- start:46 stop:633 length:588 start_codon:yes stop_codon:yes gene_type:complete
MFNGIIYNIGKVSFLQKKDKSILLGIRSSLKFSKRDIGSSICCNGVCLTLSNFKKNTSFFYISKETMNRSNFKFIKLGNLINLEKSIVYGRKISGHFIQGHVDATAKIKKITFIDKSWVVKLQLQNIKLSKFLVEKASISINGVSLTISTVNGNNFYLNIIPHSLKLTNLKNLKVNHSVNVELDIFAKYIYKFSC